MKHLGDINNITGSNVPPVDVVIGGSPCQDLSIAGKRKGLSGERSVLFMEQIRIMKEMHRRYGTAYPRFMVWENVHGALSSNKGEDFRIVLEETAKIAEPDTVIPQPPKGKWKNSGCIMGTGWSIAWRIFDAQFWGVPQRRRRIALVADFGGQSAPEILFERKGLSGNFAESREEGEGTAADTKRSAYQAVYDARENGNSENRVTDYTAICIQGNCIDRADTAGCNGKGWTEDVSYTINTVDRHAVMCMAHGQANAEVSNNTAPTLNCNHEQPIVVSVHQNADGEVRIGEVANTLSTNSNASGRNTPVIFENHGFAEYRHGIGTLKQSGGDCGGGSENLCVCCLTEWDNQARRVYSDQGIMPALSAREVSGQNQQTILTKRTVAGFSGYKSITGSIQYKEDVCPTLETNMPNNVLVETVVRRLTPLECERLQGFPDEWTDIGTYHNESGKRRQSSDTARYKALGNSIALPPWRWVLKRLCNQYDRTATMGSLFDGIGGFPLIWEEINGKGSCLWASEIEEFPIAVTGTRFIQTER